MTLAGLVFEGVVAALLIVAAVLCWRVDRRLSALRSGQDGVARSIAALAQATQRAEASVAALKAAQSDAGAELEREITRAEEAAARLRDVSGVSGGVSGSVSGTAPPAPRGSEPRVTPEPATAEHAGLAASALLQRLQAVR